MSLVDSLLYANRKYRAKIDNLIQPLRRYIGVKDLVYIEIDKEGLLTNLSTCDGWLDICFTEQYYQDDPWMVAHENQCSGVIIGGFDWDKPIESMDYSSQFYTDMRRYGFYQWIDIFQKERNATKIFSFSAVKDNHQFVANAYRNLPLIQKFVEYLDNELEVIRKSVVNKRENLSTLKTKGFNDRGVCYSEEKDEQEKLKFLVELGFLDKDIAELSLTQREKECVRLYLNGKSAKTTAEILSISRRTVECHMEGVKNKLRIRDKRELHEKLNALKEFKLIL